MKKTLLVASLMAASFSASAANFNLIPKKDWWYGTQKDKFEQTSDGITLTITSDEYLGGNQYEGIGVTTKSHLLRPIGAESLYFTFDKAVDIGTISLRQWGIADRAKLKVNGEEYTTLTGSGVSIVDNLEVNLKNVTSMSITGVIEAAHPTAFYVSGLSNVSVTPAAVPVPAAAWLLATGLAGLGVMKRRKKAA